MLWTDRRMKFCIFLSLILLYFNIVQFFTWPIQFIFNEWSYENCYTFVLHLFEHLQNNINQILFHHSFMIMIYNFPQQTLKLSVEFSRAVLCVFRCGFFFVVQRHNVWSTLTDDMVKLNTIPMTSTPQTHTLTQIIMIKIVRIISYVVDDKIERSIQHNNNNQCDVCVLS